ncbi:hypothetical protein IWZ01DRAFT_482708 [Phyllosticta capitalensis]
MTGSQDVELGNFPRNDGRANDTSNQAVASQAGSQSASSRPNSREETPPAGNQKSKNQESRRLEPDKRVSPFRKVWERIKKMWRQAWSFMLDERPYKMKERWGAISWSLFKRVLTATVLAGAIILGVLGQSFSTRRWLWHGLWINQDAQLAAFGLINTLLSYGVGDSLSHIAGTTITRWMVKEDDKGASTLDFDIEDEMREPWTAIANCYTRSENKDWTWKDFLRFVPVFIIGLSMVLLNAAMNTIAIPQDRWWPDLSFSNAVGDERAYFSNKTMRVTNVSRTAVWNQSWDMVREGPGEFSWDVAHAIAANSIFTDLSLLYETQRQPRGWRVVRDEEALMHSIVNVTRNHTSSYQAVALDGTAIGEMWTEQTKHSSNAWAQRATGWNAILKLTGILLNTSCSEAAGSAVGSWNASSRDSGTVVLDIGPASPVGGNFSGATCSISVDQVLFQCGGFYPDFPYIEPRNSTQRVFPSTDNLTAIANTQIAAELASWFSDVAPSLQALFPNQQSTNLTSIALRISNAIVERERGHTRMDGLAMVVAFTFSNMLTMFDWSFEEVSNTTTLQGPVQWRIWKSGPQREWQWVIAAVLGVLLLVQFYDVFLLFFSRYAKGLWLDLGGMLVAANAADKMAAVSDDQGAGYIPDNKTFVRYFMRQRPKEKEGDEGKAVLISSEDQKQLNEYEPLHWGEEYGKEDAG